jgi:hypothetical protein
MRHSREDVLSALHVPKPDSLGKVRHKAEAGLCSRSHKVPLPALARVVAWPPSRRQRGDWPSCGLEKFCAMRFGASASPRAATPQKS